MEGRYADTRWTCLAHEGDPIGYPDPHEYCMLLVQLGPGPDRQAPPRVPLVGHRDNGRWEMQIGMAGGLQANTSRRPRRAGFALLWLRAKTEVGVARQDCS